MNLFSVSMKMGLVRFTNFQIGTIFAGHSIAGRELNIPPYEVIPPRILDNKIPKITYRIIIKSTSRNPHSRYKNIQTIISLLENNKSTTKKRF